MASVPRKSRWEANRADEETLARLAAVQVVVDALVCGCLYPDPAVLDALSQLMGAAARWSEVAEAVAA